MEEFLADEKQKLDGNWDFETFKNSVISKYQTKKTLSGYAMEDML